MLNNILVHKNYFKLDEQREWKKRDLEILPQIVKT